jgi:hypothetical protein
MVSFHVYVKKLEDEDIKIVDSLDTNREFIQTNHSFATEQEAKDWIKTFSVNYIVRRV